MHSRTRSYWEFNPRRKGQSKWYVIHEGTTKNGKNTPVFDLFLRITSVERENIPFEEVQISEEDENYIKDLAKKRILPIF